MDLLQDLVLAIESLPVIPMAMICVTSLELDPRSYCVVATIFYFSFLLNFFGSCCSFHCYFLLIFSFITKRNKNQTIV